MKNPELLRVAAEFRDLVISLLREGDHEAAHDAIAWAFAETAAFRDPTTESDSVAKVTSPAIVRILNAGGIHTINDLTQFTFDELVIAFQFRRRSVSVIERNLDLLGFELSRE